MFLELHLRSLKDRKIPVPWATGYPDLDSKADNYLYRITLSEDLPIAELIFTPFKMTLWRDLWYVHLVCKEQKGIIAKAAEFMRERDINIIGMDTNTSFQGKYHVSRIALDCRGYGKYEEDGRHDQRRGRPEVRMRRLEKDLILKFIHEIRFFPESYPCLTVERNQSLWRLHSDVTSSAGQVTEKRMEIRERCFEIPSSVIDSLSRLYATKNTNGRSEAQALITFDPESDLLRLVVFFNNFGIVPFAVLLRNRPGAIESVTTSLKNKDYNILASKAHSIEEERMLLWMLLQHVPYELNSIDDQVIVERVTEILESSDEVRAFDPKVVAIPIY